MCLYVVFCTHLLAGGSLLTRTRRASRSRGCHPGMSSIQCAAQICIQAGVVLGFTQQLAMECLDTNSMHKMMSTFCCGRCAVPGSLPPAQSQCNYLESPPQVTLLFWLVCEIELGCSNSHSVLLWIFGVFCLMAPVPWVREAACDFAIRNSVNH